MKTLLLMRHAKSSWKTAGQPDHQRPLNRRGRRDAPRMAERLARRGITPDEVLCSTATRARETWDLMASAWDEDITLTPADRLYHAPPRDILEVAAIADRYATSLMIIGHNPGMAEAISRLTGLARHVPTAAIAWIELTIDEWPEIREIASGRLVEFWFPKDGE